MMDPSTVLSRCTHAACGASLLIASNGLAYTRTPTFGSTPTATPTSDHQVPVPFVRVSPNPVAAGDTVTLDASASTGTIASYRWSGPAEIIIDNASSPVASFVAPEVTEPTEIPIELELVGYDSTQSNFARPRIEVLPRDTVEVLIDHIRRLPGSVNPINVTLRSVGRRVVEVGNQIAFDRFASILATEDGVPDCSANEELSVESELFMFLPDDCTPGVDCAAVAAQVTATKPIPDGSIVYQCQLYLSTDPIDPGDSCRHELQCGEGNATTDSQGPLDVICKDGSATADKSEVPLSFEVSVDPPHARVGETVRIRVSASGAGERPFYRLFGTDPFLEGDIGPFSHSAFGTIEYELTAVCPGTAALRSSLSYEVEVGCPGSGRSSQGRGGSYAFEIEILPARTYSITGTVAEFPFPGGCFGAQRGATVALAPLGLLTETDLSVGGFTFDDVPAGDYVLTVEPSCNPFGCWPPTTVTVTNSDVEVQICPVAATPTATPTLPSECPGDCNQDGKVGVDEVVLAVDAAAGDRPPTCGADVNLDGRIDINDLVIVVRSALTGCFAGL